LGRLLALDTAQMAQLRAFAPEECVTFFKIQATREPRIIVLSGSIATWLLPGFDPNRVQQYRGDDHHQDSTETERDLHCKPIRDIEQRHVAGERQQNAEAIDRQRVLATAHRAAHHRRH
jgi:hypothetical protein